MIGLLLSLILSVSYAKDFTTSREAADSIHQIATALEAKGNNRSLFAHIYAITIDATTRESFENPAWVEKLIVNYANIYRRTLDNDLQGNKSAMPLTWQYEFKFVDDPSRWKATFDVIYGIKVHITRDLVEALYVTPTDFNDPSIQRDFFKVSEVLRSAMPEIWETYRRHSRTARVVTYFTGPVIADWIARLRARAWEDAKAGRSLDELDRESLSSARNWGLLNLLH